MLNKSATLVLLVSLAATQGIFASDVEDDRSSTSSSSSRTSSSATPIDSDDASPSSSIFVNLDEVNLDMLEKGPDLHATLKDLDQNGSKYVGQKVRDFVSEKVPGGSTVVLLTGLAAKKAFGTETLTEGVLNIARKPLKLDTENYPETTAGIVGKKLKKLVDLLPYGTKITAVTEKAGRTFFGTETLTEGLIEKFMAKKSENPKIEVSNTDSEEEVKVFSSAKSKNSNENESQGT